MKTIDLILERRALKVKFLIKSYRQVVIRAFKKKIKLLKSPSHAEVRWLSINHFRQKRVQGIQSLKKYISFLSLFCPQMKKSSLLQNYRKRNLLIQWQYNKFTQCIIDTNHSKERSLRNIILQQLRRIEGIKISLSLTNKRSPIKFSMDFSQISNIMSK